MTDLKERLLVHSRQTITRYCGDLNGAIVPHDLCAAAADRIQSLEAELDRVRGEFQAFARPALLAAMSDWSEETWCAEWMTGLHITLWRRIDDPEHANIKWLSERADGWPSGYPGDEGFRWLTLEEARQALSPGEE